VAFTQADADALRVAIAKGEKSVTYADRSVAYRSVEEMRQALAMVEADLAAATTPARPRQWIGTSSKGT
jgi:hypothetical protein